MNKERLVRIALGAGMLLVSGFSTYVAAEANKQPDQGRIIAGGDLFTGRGIPVRSIALEQAVVGAGTSLLGLVAVVPPVFSRRRLRQTDPV